eukprot:CAMPEP_0185789830 /NCGR_PEP_ID=MMETSP1174-20130828/153070_1 /TAXON_ID=35687 /ORGANISM="Dictyocha speculum, Strain CCMP1381" /LENGTH=109 /DNA_ID=CAMNT_0028484167 /DNA_START=1 /DNA_END=326 /DNA_ORIENTATION=-
MASASVALLAATELDRPPPLADDIPTATKIPSRLTSPPRLPTPSLPWTNQFASRVPSSPYLCALELGVLGFLGSYCNARGLADVSALEAGLLLAFINIFTPLIATVAGA